MSRRATSREELLRELLRTGRLGRVPEEKAGGSPFSVTTDECLVLALDGTILSANDPALRQLGHATGELVGRGAWEVMEGETQESVEALLSSVLQEGPQFLFGHIRRKDGSVYAVESRFRPGMHEGRRAVHWLARDARDYQVLIEERDQLISLIENSAEAILVATPEGICSYMNPAGRDLVGLQELSDVVGLGLVDLHDTEDRPTVLNEVLPAMRRGRWRGELAFRNHRGGAATPCWVNAFAIRHSQTGDVIGLAVIAHDITERKAAERQREKLQALNEVSRRVATSLLEHDDLNRAIGIVLSGVGRILGVSRSYLSRYREDRNWVFRTHQWTAAEGDIHLIDPHPESADIYAWATEILVGGNPIRIPDVSRSGLVPREGSGVLRPDVGALLVMPVIIHGRLESFFGFVDTRGARDWEDEELALLQIIVDSFGRAIERRIAEREREVIAEDLEKAVARERAANRYKSEFLANMSHELRTPMNAIVGYAELLSRPNVDAEKQSVWIGHIRRSTDYLLSLINDVLDLSKIEAGEMLVCLARTSLREVVGEVEELLAGQARERMLTFETAFTADVPEWVETDAVRLKQILVNLVGNAIKFTPSGSVRLLLSTEQDAGSPRLRIDVVDTGIGIEEEALVSLFRPFAQAHAATDPRFGGTGLGLDISRHLARLLGGEIEVESHVGTGSTFTVRLPLRAAPALEEHDAVAPATAPVSPQASLQGRRVLIVDDCPENRDVLRFLLEEAGCVVAVAEDGARGVEAALAAQREGEPHDAILMDMNMPVLDGYGATERIVAGGVASPVIALTALALAGDEERCLEAGCVAYLSKPVVPSSFLTTIARHLPDRGGPVEKPAADVPAAEARAEPADPLSLVGNPRFAPLVARYVASFGELVDDLRAAFERGDLESVRTRVHRVRGTAANYGFPAVSDAAGLCEDLIRGGAQGPEVEEALVRLEELLREARASG